MTPKLEEVIRVEVERQLTELGHPKDDTTENSSQGLDGPDRLISEQEVADILGLSKAWCQRKRWEGGGPPYIKFDRAVRYRKSELLAWIEARAGRRSTSDPGHSK